MFRAKGFFSVHSLLGIFIQFVLHDLHSLNTVYYTGRHQTKKGGLTSDHT
jgi:hypothetical protein